MPTKPPKKREYRSTARTAPGVAKALKQLGARVRELRMAAGLSQEAVANAAGLDGKHWQEIEGGRTNPTVATLVGVGRGLGVTIAALFSSS